MFYPAGSLYALAEETYRLGMYAVCNTDELRSICSTDYGGTAASFWPAVDRTLFNAVDRRPLDHDGPATIFLYARPGHWRNCWEIARPALVALKRDLGEQVRIVTAGSWARPEDLGTGIDHLGQLDLSETADLYRRADVGIALTVSRHPSYLPLELMACGVPVVAFDNPAGHWVLHDDVNSRLCRRTPESLRSTLAELALDPATRVRLGAEGERTIDRHHGDWHAVGERFASILADPEGCATTGPPVGPGTTSG
jgi:glycosyltransferase involved in cell wall biosynthesis